jgi:hypothetical protein
LPIAHNGGRTPNEYPVACVSRSVAARAAAFKLGAEAVAHQQRHGGVDGLRRGGPRVRLAV